MTHPVLASVLLAACLVQGRVSDPQGGALDAVQVVHVETGVILGTSDDSGAFSVETPDATTGTVLEFRRAQRVPLTVWFRCGDSADVVLEPLVVLAPLQFSASRLEPLAKESPIRVQHVDPAELADAAVATPSLAQLVRQMPSVGGLGRDGLTSAPTIRGLGRERSLVVVEGMRISSDRGIGPTASFVDPFLLRAMEVVRGPSGVSWGSGAMGGVISTGLGAIPQEREVSLRASASTNGDGRLLAGRAGGPLASGFRAVGGAFLRRQDDYSFPGADELAGGDALNSGFENAGGTLALERDMRGGTMRIAALGTSADDIGRPTLQERRLDTIVSEDHALVSARFQRKETHRRTEWGAAWHRPYTLNRSERFAEDGGRSRTESVDNESHDLSGSWLVERPLAEGSWLAGLDTFARVDVQSDETTVRFEDGSVSSTEFVEPIRNGQQVDAGAFLGWKHPLRTTGQWMLAARVDLARRSADERSSVRDVAPSLLAALVSPINDSWAVSGTVGRSFRSPRLQELYFAGTRPGGYRLANPDLDAETAWSAEAGIRGTAGRWSADAEVWGMIVQDLVVQLPVDVDQDTLRFENEDTGRLSGAELELRWSDARGRGDATFGISWVRGVNEDGDALPDVPPHAMRLAAQWRVLGESAGRAATVRAAVRAGGAKTPLVTGQDDEWWSDVIGTSGIGGDEAPIPAFAHLDAGLLLRVSRTLALDLAVANVLDARYLDRPESDAYPQPGRALQVALTLGN